MFSFAKINKSVHKSRLYRQITEKATKIYPCSRLNVCDPPTLKCGSPNLQRDCVWMRGLGRKLGHEGATPGVGLVPLQEETEKTRTELEGGWGSDPE